MFGRVEELERVVERVREPTVRLVTVSGRGGIGKTRLALEAARQLDPDRTGQVISVEVAGLSHGSQLLPKVASVVGVTVLSGATVLESLAGQLQHTAVLLLDNMEQLLDGAAEVEALLTRCGGLTVLATSQAPLGIPGEHVVHLGPLEVRSPAGARFEEVATSPAVAFYVDRAAAADDRFLLDASNIGAVADLCTELEGLPLAIELAAARSVLLPPAELLSRLTSDRLHLLHRPGWRSTGTDGRQHGLEASIEWTWRLLARGDQDLLGRLCVLVGHFSTRDAEELSGAGALDELDRLLALHLVERIAGTDPARFRLAASIRQFAQRRLEESGATLAAQQGRMDWLTARARMAATGLDSDDEPEERWQAEIADRQEEMIDALSLCLENGEAEAAVDLLAALGPHWLHTGCTPSLLAVFDAGLALAAEAGSRSASYAEALLWRARLARPLLDRSVSELVDLGEEIARDLDDSRLVLRALYVRMHVAFAGGNVAAAVAVAEQGLALAGEQRSRRWLARYEAWCGMVAHQSGDVARALSLARSALRHARGHDARTTVMSVMLLWPLAKESPQLVDDLPSLEETMVLARETGQFLTYLTLLFWLTVEAAEKGELEQALGWCAEGLEIATEAPGSAVAPYGLMAAVELAVAANELEVAAVLHGAGATVLRRIRRTIPPQRLLAHDRIVSRLQRQLGLVAFASARSRGEALGVGTGLRTALDWVRRTNARVSEPTSQDESAVGALNGLTGRQREILTLLAHGLSNKEIAAQLGISPKTVMHHTGSLYHRLGVHNRAEAAALAGRASFAG
jgi:non-specific serine/threonine protein kinase